MFSQKKVFFLISLLLINLILSAPTQNQDADAAYLAFKIYDGVDKLNTNSGCVIKAYHNWANGAYAIWKHYRTKECYVVIRGTKIEEISDIFTDANVIDIWDNEIKAHVHNGAKLRGDFILNDIDDALKVCKNEIIITGHSLGGSVAHYIFLKYVKRHYYDWGQQYKAKKFKAVMFGAPQLVSRSNNQKLLQFEKNINWYKYENDPFPEIISTFKKTSLPVVINLLFKSYLWISKSTLTTVHSVVYGNHIPGNRYKLHKDGKKIWYSKFPWDKSNMLDHIRVWRTYDAIVKNGWGYEHTSYDSSDTVICINENFNYYNFLNEENNFPLKEEKIKKAYQKENETIDIDTGSCIDISDDFNMTDKYQQDSVLYLKNDNLSYIIKRILDNEKEYEYAICDNDKFIVK